MSEPTSGLTTSVSTVSPPYAAIQWIAWNSPFRQTDLQLGDRLVAVNGVPVTDALLLQGLNQLPGCYAEGYFYTVSGLSAGSPLTLRIRRRRPPQGWEELELTAPLSEPLWRPRNAEGQELMDVAGPITWERDGFYEGWSTWYDEFIKKASIALNAERWHASASFSSRSLWAQLVETCEARVALAVERYPGPWSRALQQDYEQAVTRMKGATFTPPPGLLDFRERGRKLAEEMRARGATAWTAACTAAVEQTIAAFPAPSPTRDDLSVIQNKYVVLGPLHNRHYLQDCGRTFFAAGGANEGWYFMDAEAPAAQAMFSASRRYEKRIDPSLAASWELLAVLSGEARLAVVQERARYGLVAVPVAARVGGAMFVDLRQPGPATRFEGEDALVDEIPELPPADASPAQVVQALFQAIKDNDLALWRSLHARWGIEDLGQGRQRIHPYGPPPDDYFFEESRRLVLQTVVDARVAWTDAPLVMAPAGRYEGAEAIEEVELWLDHVGDFGSATAGPDYRFFFQGSVTSTWKLQRIGRGPWRVIRPNRI